ncbi:uncharacterized protein TRUGW13939_10887 [Talaromyces rugulosus]|uniref:Plasma membrane iron permease n=1 Tax=Talaromyces rugulosus TaxID=121627 RepID=A0A7H8RBM2_TALRU|nr:uncharacterized protein TRUGW13939_10887 [Talaromyces rugulosus]QKX63716.1 hypothetical protein TRUGW13939_10887 [Talaromyces rugulosus]
MVSVFAVQVFFITFRECLEAVIIVSVLLSFLKKCLGQPGQDQDIYKQLRRQVWVGSAAGIGICLVLGGAFIGVFYGLGHDIWSKSEDLWEGIFYLIAAIIITIMGLTLLRINKTQAKWQVKIARALAEHKEKKSFILGNWARRYSMFLLPFITCLREGLEAVVFIGGVSLGYPATAFPLPVITGIIAGGLVGWLIYRGGNAMSIQLFLIASTCVLYLIAAGMFSKSVWSLEFNTFGNKVGSDVAEAGDGPGSYNIFESVWHVNCCNPEIDNGWDVFNAILGWQNSATYGSVLSYNLYWVFIMVTVSCMLYQERHGFFPLQKPALQLMSRVPGLRGYALRKLNHSDADDEEIVRQVGNNMFTEVTTERVEPTK